ncbi:redoxin domain-containing protein [Pseudoduganella sp. SL102]|uniref:Redoxin domain-containing protein n=1 Tax=Pseudoduganella albidiflava TaxID=321983 RepID=A0A411X652_9BURK|nr:MULTISPECIES: redoxin domain-containing protein [Pseudoduganella]QBI04384.1 redoxin domain-containing protein [Pseudoduganella albidiflava]WBS03053.1 redoxin domain-containing protein [Pseudoduganella sp. SL102]GGY26824.1 thioredoxin family protein [Pseudoduganella albidiflava]
MKKMTTAALLAAGLLASGLAAAQATVGQPAPAFTAVDTAGKPVSLDSYKGKYVVLEWVNPDCPFVKKHYDSGNMPATQKHAAAKDVVWLSVSTSGNATKDPKVASSLNSWTKEKKATPTALVLDDGKIGQAYGAKTTPHMYLVDPAGKIVYAGAIDSKPSSNAADIAGSTNYVIQAIDEVKAGKAVSKPVTQPYGCSVKYAS